MQISMECETQESEAGYTKHLNLYWPKTKMCRYMVNRHFNSSKIIQCFNQQHSSYGIYYRESFTESTFDINMSTQWNEQLSRYVFKSNRLERLEQNFRKQIDCKRPMSTKQTI